LAAKYPWNSPYAFSENRVIDGVELEGLEVYKLNKDGEDVTIGQIGDDDTVKYVDPALIDVNTAKTNIGVINGIDSDNGVVEHSETGQSLRKALYDQLNNSSYDIIGDNTRMYSNDANITEKNDADYGEASKYTDSGEYMSAIFLEGPNEFYKFVYSYYSALGARGVASVNFTKLSGKYLIAGKGLTSFGAQYITNDKNVNFTSVVLDATSGYKTSSIIGNAFNVTYDFKQSNFIVNSVFEKEDYDNYLKRTGVSLIFGYKMNGLNNLTNKIDVSRATKNASSLMLELPLQFSNYSLQKEVQENENE